jgi:ribonuclease III
LTHPSYANETGEESNERLEFLGDAVLSLAVTDLLFHRFPERAEGELTKIRAVVVSRPVLAEVARRIGLGKHILLGRGAEEAGARERPSVLASALEALLGAAFLAQGYPAVRDLVEKLFLEEIERYAAEVPDYKSLLQEWVQAKVRRASGVPGGGGGGPGAQEGVYRGGAGRRAEGPSAGEDPKRRRNRPPRNACTFPSPTSTKPET